MKVIRSNANVTLEVVWQEWKAHDRLQKRLPNKTWMKAAFNQPHLETVAPCRQQCPLRVGMSLHLLQIRRKKHAHSENQKKSG